MSDIKKVMMANEASCNAMAAFFKEVGEASDLNAVDSSIDVIPCDDLIKGMRGFMAIAKIPHIEDSREVEVCVWFAWRFADEIKTIVDVPLENADVMLRECLQPDAGWVQCDDPMNLKKGYAHYGRSECRYFNIRIIKQLPEETRKIFQVAEDARLKAQKEAM